MIPSQIDGFVKSPPRMFRTTRAISKIRSVLIFIFLVDVVSSTFFTCLQEFCMGLF